MSRQVQPLAESEILALPAEDEESNQHLEFLLEAYKTHRSTGLPQAPTPDDYGVNLRVWWDLLDPILPEVGDDDDHREQQMAEALMAAVYLGDPDEGGVNWKSRFDSGTLDFPDYEQVIRRHFTRYLAGDEIPESGAGSETEGGSSGGN